MVVIGIEDKEYPSNLKKIINPPKKLYVDGNVNNLNKLGVAVVGSRNYSQYGEKMCKLFTKELVEYNLNIISGLAIGIDTIAHTSALQNSGITIAVLPSGLNKIYPKENNELYKKIINSGGTVVTEYEEEVEADSNKFIERNRIVSGLAIGTLVVEGAYGSGTQITARLTKKMGKPIFCIPNTLDSKNGYVVNNLIKNGAFLITEIKDILNKFEDIKFSKREEIIRKDSNENRIISDEISDVFNVISSQEIEINQICKLLNKSIEEVNYKITMLEIEGLIKELPGRRFIRNV